MSSGFLFRTLPYVPHDTLFDLPLYRLIRESFQLFGHAKKRRRRRRRRRGALHLAAAVVSVTAAGKSATRTQGSFLSFLFQVPVLFITIKQGRKKNKGKLKGFSPRWLVGCSFIACSNSVPLHLVASTYEMLRIRGLVISSLLGLLLIQPSQAVNSEVSLSDKRRKKNDF